MTQPHPRRADLHDNQPVLAQGQPVERARGVMIMVHGRGSSAEDMLSLVPLLERDDFLYLAPQANSGTWYPHSFLSELERNEPWLSAAFHKIDGVIRQVTAAGVPSERVFLMGFSQGACLISEYTARYPRRYGAVAGLSGGLIGPEGTPRDYNGDLAGTPVYLSCSQHDPHIPLPRVKQTIQVLKDLGADVQDYLYPGSTHTVTREEIEAVHALQEQMTETQDSRQAR